MDLIGIFLKSETIRDIKKSMWYHQNIFKSYVNFEKLKDVAQKLSPPRQFEFWKRSSPISANFEARRMFKVPEFSKKNSII